MHLFSFERRRQVVVLHLSPFRFKGIEPRPGEYVSMFNRFILGTSSSLFAVGITLTELEQWLRIAGAIVGLAVGLITLISIIRKGMK